LLKEASTTNKSFFEDFDEVGIFDDNETASFVARTEKEFENKFFPEPV
jgi:hypothetical protein